MTTNTNIKLIGNSNYYTWKDNMVDCLHGQNLWHITTSKEKAPPELVATGKNDKPMEAAIFKARCQNTSYLQQVNATLSMINLSLDCLLQSLTHDCLSPTKVYKALLEHFDKPDMNCDLHDFAKLLNIHMGKTKTILRYINQINILIEWMTSNNYRFKPAWTIHFILCSLLLVYSSITTIIQAQVTIMLTQAQCYNTYNCCPRHDARSSSIL